MTATANNNPRRRFATRARLVSLGSVLLLLALLVIPALMAQESDPTQVLAQANKDFAEKSYGKAAEGYEAVYRSLIEERS